MTDAPPYFALEILLGAFQRYVELHHTQPGATGFHTDEALPGQVSNTAMVGVRAGPIEAFLAVRGVNLLGHRITERASFGVFDVTYLQVSG